MPETVVYVGPSLKLSTAQTLLEATYLPPVKRGDLAQLGSEIHTVAIIDGEFFQSLSVSAMEILPLLDRGVRVYGASSMGALRAVETERYGMIGIGEIFRWFRDGIVDADDEVAVRYNPVTYRATSEALINIRFALREAVVENLLDQSRAAEVIEEVRKVHFPFRSFGLVEQMCPEIRHFLHERQPDRKRDDALLLLRRIAEARSGS